MVPDAEHPAVATNSEYGIRWIMYCMVGHRSALSENLVKYAAVNAAGHAYQLALDDVPGLIVATNNSSTPSQTGVANVAYCSQGRHGEISGRKRCAAIITPIAMATINQTEQKQQLFTSVNNGGGEGLHIPF